MLRALLVSLTLVVSTVCSQSAAAAHWRLDETMGTTASDSSPNGNTGTLFGFTGTPWTTGLHGGALTFAGGQYVSCAQNAGIPAYDSSGTPFSITAWVNGPPQDDDRFYCEASSTNNSPLYALGSGRNSNGTQDRFQLYIRNGGGGVILNAQSVTPCFDSTWHHIAVVDVGGAVTVYIDGVADTANFSYTITGLNTGIDRVALGAVLRATACCQYNGLLDDVRVYPFALSAADVNAVLNDNPLAAGFQVNQPGASLVVDGVVGSPFSPASVSLALNQPFVMELETNLPGNPWELATDTVAAIPNASVYTSNIINLDLASPSLLLLNNGFATPFALFPTIPATGSSGGVASVGVSLVAPPAATNLTLQFGLLDPTSVDGFVASAPADITVQ